MTRRPLGMRWSAGAFFEWTSFMTVSAFRLTGTITALIANGSRERLGCLERGSILIPTSDRDRAGMIAALCDSLFVRVFDRDIQEQAEHIEIETPDHSDANAVTSH